MDAEDLLRAYVADCRASPPGQGPAPTEPVITAMEVMLLRQQLRDGNAQAREAFKAWPDPAVAMFGDVVNTMRKEGWLLVPPDDGR